MTSYRDGQMKNKNYRSKNPAKTTLVCITATTILVARPELCLLLKY